MNKFPSITLVFNRLNYKSKSGAYPVHIRIFHRGKTDYIQVKDVPKIQTKDWIGDAVRGNYVKNNPQINDMLNQELTKARSLTNALVMKGSALTLKMIKDHLRNPEKLKSFNAYAHDYVRNINKNRQDSEKLSYRTIQTYHSFLTKLDDFNPKIGFDEISPELIKDFNDYLAGKCNLIKTSRSKHLDKFSVIYDQAALKKLVNFTPNLFKGYRGRNAPKHVKLNLEEIRKFKTTTLPDPTDDFYKTIFYFQLMTGLYYSDLVELRLSNFNSTELDEKGKKVTVYFLEGERTKNGERFVIRLFTNALDILKEYTTLNSGEPGDLLFPDLVSDQKFNKRLKKIATQLDIQKNITNKVARHSFGSWMVSIGNTREKLGGTFGHTEPKTTNIYSKMSPRQVLQGWIEPEI